MIEYFLPAVSLDPIVEYGDASFYILDLPTPSPLFHMGAFHSFQVTVLWTAFVLSSSNVLLQASSKQKNYSNLLWRSSNGNLHRLHEASSRSSSIIYILVKASHHERKFSWETVFFLLNAWLQLSIKRNLWQLKYALFKFSRLITGNESRFMINVFLLDLVSLNGFCGSLGLTVTLMHATVLFEVNDLIRLNGTWLVS